MKSGMDRLTKKRLIICTTVPDTVLYILKGQPAFLKQFFEVIVITSISPKSQVISEVENVQVFQINFKRNINLLNDFLALFQLIILFFKLKPTIVHSYTPKAGLLSMIASKIAFVPIRLHTFTGLIFPSKEGAIRKVLMFFDKIICLCATKVIPEGKGVMNDLKNHKITFKQLELIGNGNIAGVDTEYYNSDQISYDYATSVLGISRDLFENSVVFSFIGRLNKEKGLEELYDAFLKLPGNSILLIAGELDEEGNPISNELLENLKENNRVFLVGFLNDIRVLLKVSDFLVLPSYREGFPNVLLQSLSMRIPAIATDINGCNEIIINNYNGWLVKAKDSNDLAEKMKFVITIDKDYITKIRDNARQSIVERFKQEDYRQELLSFYNKLSDYAK